LGLGVIIRIRDTWAWGRVVAKVLHKTSLYYNVLLLLIRSNASFEFISEIEEKIILLLEKESQFEKKH